MESGSSGFEKQPSASRKSASMKSKNDWERLKSGASDAKPMPQHPEADVKHIVRGLVRKGLNLLFGRHLHRRRNRCELRACRKDDVRRWRSSPGCVDNGPAPDRHSKDGLAYGATSGWRDHCHPGIPPHALGRNPGQLGPARAHRLGADGPFFAMTCMALDYQGSAFNDVKALPCVK